ncbi:beta-galactosidase [Isoptericola haloaureus]|uniref:Beta-galactosidase n=1 Tax=Isoptericola haloaureus TaxID=1542902 RepID=A0ABU7Z9G1_9MICO
MTDARRLLGGPELDIPPRIGFGADYNPDQWPREVWAEDARLMQAAGVNVVSLAIFSWARLQPGPDEWDFAWLDEVMDLLHAHGISVDLATATASPPPWLTALHPEILPVTRTGETLWPGGRQQWRPTSPVFRRYALALVERLAERYGDHPALAGWHVSNELGCHNAHDYSDDAARAFRHWLQERYTTLDRLNEAWGTAFWSQRYTDWEQILPPRLAASYPNPTQQIDFKRFSSDALVEHLRVERDVLRRITPGIPVTTNFMVMGETQAMNYPTWAPEIDFVSNDHYLHPGPQGLDELSFSANLTSGVAGGDPWFLMEHSTSAVNWQEINTPKLPGELARDSLTHVAHGADAVCFFQWRQSAAGAEKYHSAMVPHAGEDSRLFRDVVALGETLAGLAPVVGAGRARARVAILFDWESWWASELDSHPTERLRYRQEALDWYSAFLAAGHRADVVPAATDVDGYDVVVAPVLHMVSAERAASLREFVEHGGHLVTTYFSGVVDTDDHIWLGGYPGAFRDLLGIRVEEFAPLRDGDDVRLDDGSVGTLWADPVDLVAEDVEVLASYADGRYAGRPAITRRPVGQGSAAYVATRLGPHGLVPGVERLLADAGVTSELPTTLRGKVELTVRRRDDVTFWFLVNRTAEPLPLAGIEGEVLVSTGAGDDVGPDHLQPRGVVVLRRPA